MAFYHPVPSAMSRTVVDGVKNNYGLLGVIGLTFDDNDRIQSEIESYPHANRFGRTDVHTAVSHPDDRRLQLKAIGALHRLASSDDDAATTDLFLCMQLFLPARSTRPDPLRC